MIPRNAQKPSDRRRKELPKIESIIESYGQYVYNLALKLSANPEYADDLMQETFIKAWLHIIVTWSSGKYCRIITSLKLLLLVPTQ